MPGNKEKPNLNSDTAKRIFHASAVNTFPPYFSSNDSLENTPGKWRTRPRGKEQTSPHSGSACAVPARPARGRRVKGKGERAAPGPGTG